MTSIKAAKNEAGKLEARLAAAQDRKRAAEAQAAEAVEAMIHAGAERREELEQEHSEAITQARRAAALVEDLRARRDTARIALAEAELEAAKEQAKAVNEARKAAGAKLQEAKQAVRLAHRNPEARAEAKKALIDVQEEVRKAQIAHLAAGDEVRAARGMVDALSGLDPDRDYYDTHSQQERAEACRAARQRLVDEGVQPPALDLSRPRLKSAFALR